MTETPRCPALGFVLAGKQEEIPGAENLDWFPDAEALSTVWGGELKDGQRLGMVVVDSDFNAWRVTNVVARGALPTSLWNRLWGIRQYRVDQQFEPLGPMTLEQVQDRITLAMMSNHLFSAGGTMHRSIARVRAAQTIADLNDAIWS